MKFYFVQNQFVAESLSRATNVNIFNAEEFNDIVTKTTGKQGLASKLAMAMFKNVIGAAGNIIIPFPEGTTMDEYVGSVLKECVQSFSKEDVVVVTMGDVDNDFFENVPCNRVNLVEAIWTFLQSGEVPFDVKDAGNTSVPTSVDFNDMPNASDMP